MGPTRLPPRPSAKGDQEQGPLRVSSLELFFDLVFAFTLTQLASLLAARLSAAGAAQALLVFGVLWWMYGGYAWLTNARTPDQTPERLMLLLGMAGFLAVGMAIPGGFGDRASGVALGLGYLVVVGVHAGLYYRVNRNIMRVAPFNLVSALCVLAAGTAGPGAAYALWAAALAVQAASPLIARPRGRFEISPAHFVERHGALVIVALGEAVAAVGIGAAPHPVSPALAAAAVLGLGLSASLWWAYFGHGDDERAERALTAAERPARPGLALSAFFFAHIPMLAGIVTTAAALMLTIAHAGQPRPAGQALALGAGVALFLAGHAVFRKTLRIGRAGPRLAAAVFALASVPIGMEVALEVQLALMAAGMVVMLSVDRRDARRPGSLPASERAEP